MMDNQIQFLSSSPATFSRKLDDNYISCSLIGKNIIDVEVYLSRELKTLKGSYSYDSLMQEFKTAFESCQRLFGFLRDNRMKQCVRVVQGGLSVEVSQSGVKRRILLSLSCFSMTEKETKELVGRLLEENHKLQREIQKQAQEHNILFEEMLKENQKPPKQEEQDQHQKEKELLMRQEYLKIPKTKIISKDREQVKQYKRSSQIHHFQEGKMLKLCVVCKKHFEGKDYFRYCMGCFDRNREYIKKY